MKIDKERFQEWLRDHAEFAVDEDELWAMYDQYLDEIGTIDFGGVKYEGSRVLRELDPTVKMENLKKIKAGDIIIYQDFMQRKFISVVVTRVSDVLPQYSPPWTISTRDTAREDGYIFEENGYATTFSCVAGVIVGWYKTGMSYEDIYV